MEVLGRCMIVILVSQHIRRTSQYGDESGREFVLVFPVLTGTLQDDDIYLYVKGSNNGEVEVTANGMTTISMTVTSLAQQILIPSTMFYTNFGTIEHMGVHVTATKDVTLYVMRGAEEGYMALPHGVWSTEFCIVSYTPVVDGYSYFAFTAYRNDTAVDITFKTEDTWTCLGYTPVSGQTVTIALNQHHVWGLYCKNDLTGTLLKSNKPISVISGAIVPWTDPTITLQDFMEEMLLPIQSHGRHFALPSIPDVSTIYRITASVNNTLLDAEGWIYTHLDVGEYFDLNLNDVNFYCLKSNHPIQVMIVGVAASDSPSSADGFLGDVFMATIPPVETFEKSHDIELFHTTADRSHLFFLMESIYKEDMKDSLPWTPSSHWLTSGCCKYGAVHLVDIPSSSSVIHISKEYSIGVVQLGTNFGEGFGFLDGLAYGAPFCTSTYETLNGTKMCVRGYTTPATWQESSDACAQQRSRLVKLDSFSKITEVKDYFFDQLDTQRFWIGLTKDSSPYFYWPDGDVLISSDWGDPSTAGKCVSLGKETTAGWFRQSCHSTNGYICENFVAKSNDIDMFPASCFDTHPQCGADYTYLGEASLCIRVSNIPRNWTAAAADCLSTGDRLVLVVNKISVLETFMRNSWPDYHIGVFYHNLTWVGSNCAPLNITHWGLGQPGPGEAEGCVSSVEGAWQTGPCDISLPYVCEKNIGTTGTSDPFVRDPSCEDPVSSTILSSSSVLAGLTSSAIFEALSTSLIAFSSDVPNLSTEYLHGSLSIDLSTSILHEDITSASSSVEFIDITTAFSDSTDTRGIVSTPAVHLSPLPSSFSLDSTSDPRPEPSTSEACRCGCLAATRLTNLSPSAVSAKDKEIKNELLLNTKNLTKHIIKYISIKDDRPSASGVGALGVLLIVFTAIVIFGSDVISLLNVTERKKTGSKDKEKQKI